MNQTLRAAPVRRGLEKPANSGEIQQLKREAGGTYGGGWWEFCLCSNRLLLSVATPHKKCFQGLDL